MTQKQAKTKKQKKPTSTRQKVVSWASGILTTIDSDDFKAKMVSETNPKWIEYRETKVLFAETCIRSDYKICTRRENKGSEVESTAFNRLHVLKAKYGRYFANKIERGQLQTELGLFRNPKDTLPKVAQEKWLEYLEHRPIHATRRIFRNNLYVTCIGQKIETKLGPVFTWVGNSSPSADSIKTTDPVEAMQADIKAYTANTVISDPKPIEKPKTKAKPKKETAPTTAQIKGSNRKSQAKDKAKA